MRYRPCRIKAPRLWQININICRCIIHQFAYRFHCFLFLLWWLNLDFRQFNTLLTFYHSFNRWSLKLLFKYFLSWWNLIFLRIYRFIIQKKFGLFLRFRSNYFLLIFFWFDFFYQLFWLYLGHWRWNTDFYLLELSFNIFDRFI